MASIIERIDLGCGSNLMRVFISLATAWGSFLGRFNLVQKKLYKIRSSSEKSNIEDIGAFWDGIKSEETYPTFLIRY
jgi:hypothetical protein